ncbi:MAG: pyridoxamine kinase [Clostridia bacterium]|nr:pyridoxamine kinase [Clostridia bacterium]
MKNNSKRKLPRVAALHDLSCFGRCALTVIIPALSASGIQTIPVPTALLSTHTGGFTNMHFRDLDDSIGDIARHFGELGLDFDAIYTGFLGSERQVRTVEDFIDKTADENTLIFVDPVMGDDGKLYSACFPELVAEMRRLCARADIITPNLTEACLMTDTEYPDLSEHSEEEAEAAIGAIAEKIKSFTNAECVVTGVHFKDGVGTYCLGKMHSERARRNDYPGTGDLFASVMLAYILKSGKPLYREILQKSAEYASRFTAEVIDYSLEYGDAEPRRDGVLLEGCLGKLVADMNMAKNSEVAH